VSFKKSNNVFKENYIFTKKVLLLIDVFLIIINYG